MAKWQLLPGETPIDDISELKIRNVKTRGELNELEAANILKATLKYLGKKPTRRSARFDFSWGLKLHKEMFGDVWRWAGKMRTSDLNIGMPWQQVEPALFELFQNLTLWEQSEVDLMDQVTWLHHRAVFIHPFKNGNGRWARMLANVWLKLHGENPTMWPEASVGTVSEIREEYLKAVRLGDEGDFELLKNLHKRYTSAKEH